MEIKVIRIGNSEDAYAHFDDPVVPLTEDQKDKIEQSAKEAVKEMSEFFGETE